MTQTRSAAFETTLEPSGDTAGIVVRPRWWTASVREQDPA
jgi:hypothetical protein